MRHPETRDPKQARLAPRLILPPVRTTQVRQCALRPRLFTRAQPRERRDRSSSAPHLRPARAIPAPCAGAPLVGPARSQPRGTFAGTRRCPSTSAPAGSPPTRRS
eukprot:5008767-Prymnesium_polylepis.1